MSNRINYLVDAMIGDLQTMITDELVTAVIVADKKFSDALTRGGKVDLPLCGVAYGGTAKAEPIDGDDLTSRAVARFSIFLVLRDRGGVASELTDDGQLYDLVDKVVDLLAGKTPLKQSRAGELILDDDEQQQPLGVAWIYRSDEPIGLAKDVHAKGLRAWAVRFECLHAFRPARADVTAQDEPIEAIVGEFDSRFGEDPETPDEDMDEIILDLGD